MTCNYGGCLLAAVADTQGDGVADTQGDGATETISKTEKRKYLRENTPSSPPPPHPLTHTHPHPHPHSHTCTCRYRPVHI